MAKAASRLHTSAMTPSAHTAVVLDFAAMLRGQRRVRRLSQLDLALRAEVSQRHLSFLESGRARPSRDMVLHLAAVLDLPLAERNQWLQAAGFAAHYAQRDIGAVDMTPVRSALQLLLHHHEPLPAVVIDRQWNVVMSNRAMDCLLSLPGDVDARWHRVCGQGPRNLLKLTLHAEGLRPYIVNFGEVAGAILARLTREAQEYPELRSLLEDVLRYPGLPSRRLATEPIVADLPVLSTQLEMHGMRLQLFSMLSSFGTPLDITADLLRVEQFFPADADSERLLKALGEGG